MRTHLLSFSALASLMLCTTASAVPAYPGLIDYRQTDGSVLKVKMRGDESLHWSETADGYVDVDKRQAALTVQKVAGYNNVAFSTQTKTGIMGDKAGAMKKQQGVAPVVSADATPSGLLFAGMSPSGYRFNNNLAMMPVYGNMQILNTTQDEATSWQWSIESSNEGSIYGNDRNFSFDTTFGTYYNLSLTGWNADAQSETYHVGLGGDENYSYEQFYAYAGEMQSDFDMGDGTHAIMTALNPANVLKWYTNWATPDICSNSMSKIYVYGGCPSTPLYFSGIEVPMVDFQDHGSFHLICRLMHCYRDEEGNLSLGDEFAVSEATSNDLTYYDSGITLMSFRNFTVYLPRYGYWTSVDHLFVNEEFVIVLEGFDNGTFSGVMGCEANADAGRVSTWFELTGEEGSMYRYNGWFTKLFVGFENAAYGYLKPSDGSTIWFDANGGENYVNIDAFYNENGSTWFSYEPGYEAPDWVNISVSEENYGDGQSTFVLKVCADPNFGAYRDAFFRIYQPGAYLEFFVYQNAYAGGLDYSQEPNVIYAEGTSAKAGQQIEIPIYMNNQEDVVAYQFDMYLPDGISVATDELGNLMIKRAGDRYNYSQESGDSHTVQSSYRSDGGFYRVLCTSSDNDVISGNNGQVAVVTLNIESWVSDGYHQMKLTNEKLVHEDTLSDTYGDVHVMLNVSGSLSPLKTAYYVNYYGWDEVYAYVWDDVIGEYLPWPGEPATKMDYQLAGCDVYAYRVPESKYNYIIFNNGGHGIQTADLWFNADWYYYGETWYEREYFERLNYIVSVDPAEYSTIRPDASVTYTFAHPVRSDDYYCLYGLMNTWIFTNSDYIDVSFNEDQTQMTVRFNYDMCFGSTDVSELMQLTGDDTMFYYAYVYDQETGMFMNCPTRYYYVDATVSNLVVDQYKTIGDQFSLTENASVSVYADFQGGIGHLDFWRSEPLNLGSFQFSYDPYLDYQWNSYGLSGVGCRYNQSSPTLLTNGSIVTANEVSATVRLCAGNWSFLSLPFDVDLAEVTCANEVPWVAYTYSGENRASGEENTLVKLTGVVTAGTAFIIKSSQYGPNGWASESILTFNAIDSEAKNNIFLGEDRTVELGLYPSESAHNSGWNFVANPYPAYFDSRLMSCGAPFTVWDAWNQEYSAWSPIDDEYVFAPGEAFFVQATDEVASLTFPVEGAQHDCMAYYRDLPVRVKAQSAVRNVFNILLREAGEEQSRGNRTRIVLNEGAASNYSASEDAAKFDAMNADALRIYVVDGNIRYAIDERPLGDGTAQIGMKVAKAGEYTISLNTTSDVKVTLVDRESGVRTLLNENSYSFSAMSGVDETRFVVEFEGAANAIENMDAEDNAVRYNLNGIRVAEDGAGIYVKNGRKIVNR